MISNNNGPVNAHYCGGRYAAVGGIMIIGRWPTGEPTDRRRCEQSPPPVAAAVAVPCSGAHAPLARSPMTSFLTMYDYCCCCSCAAVTPPKPHLLSSTQQKQLTSRILPFITNIQPQL